MATIEEYAILSTRAYPRTPNNTTNLPPGWTELVPPTNDAVSGFSAGVYLKDGEIVIAYTGTNQDKWKDFATGNISASVGIPADQVFEAMELYINVKKKYGGAISFTGHSLGGGLASLMAVFFGKLATTFDPAPFEATVANLNTLKSYQSMLKNDGLSDADFDFAISNPSFFQIRRTAVDYYSLKGEVLSFLRNGLPTQNGVSSNIPTFSNYVSAARTARLTVM